MRTRGGSSSRLVLWGSAFELALGVVAVALGAAIGRNPVAWLLLTPRAMVLGVAATVPPVVLLLLFLRSSRESPAGIRRLLVRLLRPLLTGMNPLRATALSLAAGLGEELLFRGLVQTALAAAIGPVPALVASSLLFGALHWITPLYALYATLFGLYLGALFMVSGSLLAPILVHALYDGVALLALARQARGATEPGMGAWW